MWIEYKRLWSEKEDRQTSRRGPICIACQEELDNVGIHPSEEIALCDMNKIPMCLVGGLHSFRIRSAFKLHS